MQTKKNSLQKYIVRCNNYFPKAKNWNTLLHNSEYLLLEDFVFKFNTGGKLIFD